MRLRLFLSVSLLLGSSAFGCNAITGIGGLTFSDNNGNPSGDDGGNPNGPDATSGNDGGPAPITGDGGPVLPSGTKLVPSSTLTLLGMTTDGYVVYADTATSTLYTLGIEQPDGGPPASSSPTTLGQADLATVGVEGRVVSFFTGQVDAGASRTGALSVWTSTVGIKALATNVLMPDYANSFYTIATGAEGRYVSYYTTVDPTGYTGSLFYADLLSGVVKQVAGPVDILEDVCQPHAVFSGAQFLGGLCNVSGPGARVPPQTLPDGGPDKDIATVSNYIGSVPTQLASKVGTHFGVDSNGVAAILFSDNGLETVAQTGGPVVPVDSTAYSAEITSDGQAVLYTTTSNALMRARTFSPPSPTLLATGAFKVVEAVSHDGSWVAGATNGGAKKGTYDLYVASATAKSTPVTLSSATTATIGSAGDSFTTDSKYALYLTGVNASWIGTFTAHDLGANATTTVAQGTYEEIGAGASRVVFNMNTASDKGDIAWQDLASGGSPLLLVNAADAYFLVGPAKDKAVYTLRGGANDGLWVTPLPGSCPGASAIIFHPPAGGPGSCSAQDVAAYDKACVNTTTANSNDCTNLQLSAACNACLTTPTSAAQWGAMTVDPNAGSIDQLDNGACFARQGNMVCAYEYEAERECVNTNCDSSADLSTFQTCENAATSSGGACFCFTTARTAACANLTTSNCDEASYSSFEQGFLQIAQVMCE